MIKSGNNIEIKILYLSNLALLIFAWMVFLCMWKWEKDKKLNSFKWLFDLSKIYIFHYRNELIK